MSSSRPIRSKLLKRKGRQNAARVPQRSAGGLAAHEERRRSDTFGGADGFARAVSSGPDAGNSGMLSNPLFAAWIPSIGNSIQAAETEGPLRPSWSEADERVARQHQENLRGPSHGPLSPTADIALQIEADELTTRQLQERIDGEGGPSPGPLSQVKASTLPPGRFWACSRCTCMNPSTGQTCVDCSQPRLPGVESSGSDIAGPEVGSMVAVRVAGLLEMQRQHVGGDGYMAPGGMSHAPGSGHPDDTGDSDYAEPDGSVATAITAQTDYSVVGPEQLWGAATAQGPRRPYENAVAQREAGDRGPGAPSAHRPYENVAVQRSSVAPPTTERSSAAGVGEGGNTNDSAPRRLYENAHGQSAADASDNNNPPGASGAGAYDTVVLMNVHPSVSSSPQTEYDTVVDMRLPIDQQASAC